MTAHKRHKTIHLDNVANVVACMRNGCALHLEYRNGERRWWLSDGRTVLDRTAKAVIASKNVVSVGDALFGFMQSQTWRHAELEI